MGKQESKRGESGAWGARERTKWNADKSEGAQDDEGAIELRPRSRVDFLWPQRERGQDGGDKRWEGRETRDDQTGKDERREE